MEHTHLLIHQAAQYLAAFGINYIPHEKDDSHSNLEWDVTSQKLRSRKTHNGQQLSLDIAQMQLEWQGEGTDLIPLLGRSHGEIMIALHYNAIQMGWEEYDYRIHYNIGDAKMIPPDVYHSFDRESAQSWMNLRNTAQSILITFANKANLDVELRVWPNHFDSAALIALSEKPERSIGFGMAVPDSVSDSYYFYVSGYDSGKAINTQPDWPLTHGKWKTDGFKGAVLNVSAASSENVLQFFDEAMSAYRSH